MLEIGMENVRFNCELVVFIEDLTNIFVKFVDWNQSLSLKTI